MLFCYTVISILTQRIKMILSECAALHSSWPMIIRATVSHILFRWSGSDLMGSFIMVGMLLLAFSFEFFVLKGMDSLQYSRDEHWTELWLGWIQDIANCVEFGLDPDCKSFQNLGSGPDLDCVNTVEKKCGIFDTENVAFFKYFGLHLDLHS